ncbi:substrate-binding domain-containing protein [Kitasatospora sp. NPDC006697]|uniref:substrate-binding domain-containing protein n=1 Tax=Kitasatospora sp. NPDC006697 TaxID=3364020 RepID=UPI00368A702E
MEREITGLSSMATRQLLADLSERIGRSHGIPLRFESGGGVEIARRVRAGAEADLLVLAEDALAALAAEGRLRPGTVRPLWVSQVVAAVPVGAPAPALGTEAELRAALTAAGRIAYSTGPSGTAVLELIARYGLTDRLDLVQAPPGVPVGSLLAAGEAALAFQQRSELAGLPGVLVLGPLPGEAAISSTFAGGVLAGAVAPERALAVLELLATDEASETARARGMAPAGR